MELKDKNTHNRNELNKGAEIRHNGNGVIPPAYEIVKVNTTVNTTEPEDTQARTHSHIHAHARTLAQLNAHDSSIE